MPESGASQLGLDQLVIRQNLLFLQKGNFGKGCIRGDQSSLRRLGANRWGAGEEGDIRNENGNVEIMQEGFRAI
jgi:hypothetical protein